jgi:uncharacterized SAM-binding protein YcdF (DUF218 family)
MRRVVVAILIAAAVAWILSLALVIRAARRDEAAPAQAIIVLGAAQYAGRPSPVLRARLDHAAGLWRRGLAPLVIVTGGMGARDTTSEAAVGRRYLREIGLPDSALIAEATGRESESSLRAAAAHLTGPDPRVILVSDGFHMQRLAVVARRLGLQPFGSPAPDSPIRANQRREAGYLLAESVKWPVAFLFTRSP